MAVFKKGDAVRQIIPAPIQGIIIERRVSDDDSIIVLVGWLDAAGDKQARWFSEDQLELISGV